MEEQHESHPIEDLREDGAADNEVTTDDTVRKSTYFQEKIHIPRTEGVGIVYRTTHV